MIRDNPQKLKYTKSSKIIPKTRTSIAFVELINSKKGVKGVATTLKNITPIKKNGK